MASGERLLETGKVTAADLQLVRVTDDPAEVVKIVCAGAARQGLAA